MSWVMKGEAVQELTIAHLGSFDGGGTPSKSVSGFWSEAGLPWVTPKDMKSDILVATEDYLTQKGVLAAGLRIYEPGSIAVVFRSGVLRHSFPVACASVPFTVNQDMKVLTPSAEISSRYAYHVLRGIEWRVVNSAVKSGTTVESVDFGLFKRLQIHLPPLPEQRRIAEILDTVDEAIRKTEQVIAKLQQMKQGLLHDLLTRGIDENGELRDPERHPEQFKDSPLGRIPKRWDGRPLDELTSAPVCYGIVQAGPYIDGGPQVLMIRDLEGNYRTGLHRTSRVIDEQYSRSRVRAGDLLLSIKGTIGRIGVVPSHYQGNISRDLARIRFAEEVVPHFARQYLLSPVGQMRIALSVVGTTRAEVSIHVLKRLILPVPPQEEQAMIVEALAGFDSRLEREEHQSAKCRAIRAGLMNDLLTGRVRVAVPEEAA